MSKVIAFSHQQDKNGGRSCPLLDAQKIPYSQRLVLNQLCSSLSHPGNRSRFRAFPEGYCREYGLTLEQIHAITDLDILRLLKLGCTMSSLELLIGVYGLDILQLCCEQTGKSPEEIRQLFGWH